MRSIERKCKKVEMKLQIFGVFPCMTQVVKNQRFSRKSLVKAFKKLMPEDEYDKDETKELIDYLEYLTNLSEEGEI